MKTPALTLLLVSVVLAGCDTSPLNEGTQTGPDAGSPTSCTLDPATITQVAHVTGAVASDSSCDSTAASESASLDIVKGRVNGAPIVVTDVKSYDGTSLGVRCVYDVTGTVDEPATSTCFVRVGFTARVKVE